MPAPFAEDAFFYQLYNFSHFTQVRKAKIKTLMIAYAGEDAQYREYVSVAGGDVNL